MQCTEQKNKLVDVRMNYLQNHPKRDFSASAENNDDYDNPVSYTHLDVYKRQRDFDMVTLDRVRYLNIEADYKVWKEYARAKHLHNAILSYLELRQKNFYRVEADVRCV